jgi:hypothetical protein
MPSPLHLKYGCFGMPTGHPAPPKECSTSLHDSGQSEAPAWESRTLCTHQVISVLYSYNSSPPMHQQTPKPVPHLNCRKLRRQGFFPLFLFLSLYLSLSRPLSSCPPSRGPKAESFLPNARSRGVCGKCLKSSIRPPTL